MATTNYITTVAIVGAGGNIGRFITSSLLKTNKHNVTALTRIDSQSDLPKGIVIRKVDYNNHETLVEALRGQDALVITLSGYASKDTETQLINAAGEAGVAWILPSEFAPDTTNEDLVKDVFVFQPKVATRKAITSLKKSSYISVITGFWYEYTLAMPQSFGIDFAKRSATFFDKGETKISVSTLPQVGRAVAALLSLPIKPPSGAEEDTTAAGRRRVYLDEFRNKPVYVSSFTISQKEMLQSALRVTGTKETDWVITSEPSHERYENGVREISEGKRSRYAKMMYTRLFFPDGSGDFSDRTSNEELELLREDLDEATERAIEMAKGMRNWVDS